MEQLDLRIFDLSPMPMWIQDYSGVKKIFEQWNAQGILDIRAYLLEDPSRLLPALATIKTLMVNRSTLKLYEANNLDEILESFSKFHFPEITVPQVIFFTALLEQDSDCMFAPINYTCTGKQIDVQLRANIINGYEDTWEKILFTTEDITPYQKARRFAESIFMYSPTALWVKDYAEIKQCFDQLKQQGVTHLDQHIVDHPEFIQSCVKKIKSIHVNQALLKLFHLETKAQFDAQLVSLLSQNNYQNIYAQLLHLWKSSTQLERECEYQLADGSILNVLEQMNLFPDSQDNWNTIQVAFTNLTERKALENHLHYLSKYDQLTQLHNRTFFNEELIRLESQTIRPITCIYMDVNGLKEVNDVQGHHHGDLLLKRFANILIDATQSKDCSVSRVGGDEFVILMPSATEQDAQALMDEIEYLLALENVHNSRISVASGFASTDHHPNLENLIKIADENMYRKKRNHYSLS